MPSIGPLELLVVLGIILLIFGPKRLPGAGRALGQGIREFKESITGRSKDGADREPAELPPAAAQPSADPDRAQTVAGPAEGDPVAKE